MSKIVLTPNIFLELEDHSPITEKEMNSVSLFSTTSTMMEFASMMYPAIIVNRLSVKLKNRLKPDPNQIFRMQRD